MHKSTPSKIFHLKVKSMYLVFYRYVDVFHCNKQLAAIALAKFRPILLYLLQIGPLKSHKKYSQSTMLPPHNLITLVEVYIKEKDNLYIYFVFISICDRTCIANQFSVLQSRLTLVYQLVLTRLEILHILEYFFNIAINLMRMCKNTYEYSVSSLVTYNAAMTGMRET